MHMEETKRLESLDGDHAPTNEEVEEPEPEEPEPEVHIQDELPITLPPSATLTTPSSSSSSKSKKSQKKDRKDAPVLSKEKVEDWEKVSDIYNGADMKNYKWSQTITDIDIKIPVPVGTTAKAVKVDIRSDYLKVELLRPTTQVCILL